MFHLKRVYEESSAKDGCRILVERLWPRGLSKERAAVDLWLKDVAPSPELRKWFNHDPGLLGPDEMDTLQLPICLQKLIQPVVIVG